MLYLRVNQREGLKKQMHKWKGERITWKKILSISWFSANHKNNFSLLKEVSSVLLRSVSFLTMQVVVAILLN